jgi:hypothetical protein
MNAKEHNKLIEDAALAVDVVDGPSGLYAQLGDAAATRKACAVAVRALKIPEEGEEAWIDAQTLDAWIASEKQDLLEINAQLSSEKDYISPESVDGFAAFWREKNAAQPQIYPLSDAGYGDLFWLEIFHEWLDSGTVDEQNLIDMACLDYPADNAK